MLRFRPSLMALLCLLVAVIGIAACSLPAVKHANLGPLPPGSKATGSIITLPPPSVWDAPKAPPAK